MKLREKRAGAFSLVELVIVIVILGIIAAVAIPRLSSGSRNAGEAALRANLQTLRNAIDWYYAEHHNTFPGAKGDGTNAADTPEAFVTQLCEYSKVDGSTSEAADPDYPFGPYLRGGVPALTVGANAGKNTVVIKNQAGLLAAETSTDAGWIYNVATGQIIPNADEAGSDGNTYDTY